MSFLAPLYLLAGFAIAGPILFHLIRRTPRGRQVFSSVMFLQPSPPRLTKRSRIEDCLVLILRGLAILLLALAFARPYFRSTALTSLDESAGRRIVLLVDTSASMRRGDLWQEAQQRVHDELNDLQPQDTLTCLLFDRVRTPLMSAEESRQLPAANRSQILLDRLAAITPTWERTNLAAALIDAAERLDLATTTARDVREVIVISDQQRGSDWDELQSHTWPDSVRLRLVPVGQDESPNNVTVQVVEDANATDDVVRVRVSNAANSSESLFLLSWAREFDDDSTSDDATETQTVPVHVPPGQSRVVRAPERAVEGSTHRLQLTGDDHEFDNTCYIAHQVPWTANIVWMGEPGTTETSPRFFLDPLFPSSPRRTTSVQDWSDTSPNDLPQDVALIICGTNPDVPQQAWMREQIELGGSVLYVARSADQAAGVFSLLNVPPVPLTDETADDYYMLGPIDFAHPLLRTFDDPRFSDFTKLRFWKRRHIADLAGTQAKVVLQFEDQAPALVQWSEGDGHVFLLAASWTRDDSELALWSKFPPLMNSLLELGRPPALSRRQYTVGESVSLATGLEMDAEQVVIQRGDEAAQTLSRSERLQFDQPGLMHLAATAPELVGSPLELAVNLVAEESELTPLTRHDFEAAGISLESTTETETVTDPARQRQLMNAELESQQQWWRWLLVVVLALLIVETLLASRRAQVPVPA